VCACAADGGAPDTERRIWSARALDAVEAIRPEAERRGRGMPGREAVRVRRRSIRALTLPPQ